MLRPALVSVASVIVVAACSGSSRNTIVGSKDGGAGNNADASSVFEPEAGMPSKNCENLECQVAKCDDDGKTTLKGIVVAPTPAAFGEPDPIYNAIVYIPNGEVEPFEKGVGCDKCGTPVSGKPLTVALTNERGEFTLEDVPSGEDIPLVIQIGRWRRQVTVPSIDECTENEVSTELTRLPRSSKEGDIPQIAIVTSPYDPTECILRKIGIDEDEFTGPSGKGRVHIYQGGGAGIAGAQPGELLSSTGAQLAKYDLVAFPCSSHPTNPASAQNLIDYTSAGGRVFLTDLSYPAISEAPDWATTANWTAGSDFGNLTAQIDTSFAKGEAMAEWLKVTGATPNKGVIQLQDTYSRFTAVGPAGQRWIYAAGGPQTYSFNTPVDAKEEDQCGRVVYSSFHIADTGSSGGFGDDFPMHCSDGPLTPQERALEFMLFDLSSCVQKDDKPPVKPPK